LPRMGDRPGPLPTTKWGAIVQILGEILSIMMGGGGTGRPGPFTTGPVVVDPEPAPPFDWDECIKANMCT